MRVSCPMCGGKTRVVRSALVTAITRQGDAVCLNPDCGWTGTVVITIHSTKSPGLLAAQQGSPMLHSGGSPCIKAVAKS